MSLNEIRLTPGLLVDLYASSLVEGTTISKPIVSPIPFLGKNNKGILVVSATENAAFLTDSEFSFLTSILLACKLSLEDVAVVNWKGHEGLNERILAEVRSERVLLFDVNPVTFGLPINFPHFQIQQFSGRTYLYAPSLGEIERDLSVKKQLWSSLKRLFNLA